MKTFRCLRLTAMLGFVVGNAAESEVQGIETDVLFRLTEEITLNGAFAYLDATYKSFPGAGCNLAQTSGGRSRLYSRPERPAAAVCS